MTQCIPNDFPVGLRRGFHITVRAIVSDERRGTWR